jgi:hypothetical protein
MDAQRIYRIFRTDALRSAERHNVPVEDALLALARAASECPPNLARFQIARRVRTHTEQLIVQSKQSGGELRETG